MDTWLKFSHHDTTVCLIADIVRLAMSGLSTYHHVGDLTDCFPFLCFFIRVKSALVLLSADAGPKKEGRLEPTV